jgi:hypothetical protein
MSSFIKLEGTYLKILRYSILVLATLVLGLTLVTAVIGLSNVGAFNLPKKEIPKVSTDTILSNIVNTKNTTSIQGKGSNQFENGKIQADPNQQYYERSDKAVKNFITAYSNINFNQPLVDIFRSKAQVYRDNEVVQAFASGMADTLEKVLSDKSVIKRAANGTAIVIVEQVIKNYESDFNIELSRINEEKAANEMKISMKRSSGVMLLSVAGGSFLAFLLLAFLMIFVKIELNLREMASKS